MLRKKINEIKINTENVSFISVLHVKSHLRLQF